MLVSTGSEPLNEWRLFQVSHTVMQNDLRLNDYTPAMFPGEFRQARQPNDYCNPSQNLL